MNSDLKWTEVKIAYKFPNIQTFTLPMVSYQKQANKWETLCSDGKYEPRTLTAEDEKKGIFPAKIILTKQEEIEIPDPLGGKQTQRGTRCYGKLRYVQENQEHLIANQDERSKSAMDRKMHSFINGHWNAEVLDMKGKNTNNNLRTVLVVVIDETNSIRATKAKNELITECRNIITSLSKVDEKGFEDLCYVLKLPNISDGTSESLYNKMIEKMESNPVYFKEVYNSAQKSLMAMINRAIYQPLSNGDAAIEQKNGYFQLDGVAIGKKEEDMVDFFNSNPEALKRLEQKMGVFLPRNVMKKLEDKLEPPLIDKSDNTSVPDATKAKMQEETELKQKVYRLGWGRLTQKKTLTNEDWDKYIEKINELKKEHPGSDMFIDEKVDNFCEKNGLTNPYKKTLMTN